MHTRDRRRRDQRGAVAMEAALVLPVIMLLVFGMIDMSLMLRDYVGITAATRAGTRLAAAEADAGPCVNNPGDTTSCTTAQATTIPEVAQDAADQLQKNLGGVPANSINYILVYEANQYGFPCLSGSVYTGNNASNGKPINNCNPALATSADTNKTMPSDCGTTYGHCIKFTWNSAANGGAGAFRYSNGSWNSQYISACQGVEDYVGIYINISHKWLTGIFTNGTYTMQDKSVMQFEPLPDTTCDATKVSAHS